MDDKGEAVVGFTGGFDIAPERYDSSLHELYPGCNPGNKERSFGYASGDWQDHLFPWHDIHAKVEGTIALDIYKQFKSRWFSDVDNSKYRPLYNIADLTKRMNSLRSTDGFDWASQLIQSVSKVSDTRNELDNSIYVAHINEIRKANNFIYIENQYFYGSSNNWFTKKDYHIRNAIPFEIVKKITSKIEANEKFTVFILIPMWPRGAFKEPTAYSTQEMLFYQTKTMEFMYHEIGLAIKIAISRGTLNSKIKPTDYLKFFCLGKTISKKYKHWLENIDTLLRDHNRGYLRKYRLHFNELKWMN